MRAFVKNPMSNTYVTAQVPRSAGNSVVLQKLPMDPLLVIQETPEVTDPVTPEKPASPLSRLAAAFKLPRG